MTSALRRRQQRRFPGLYRGIVFDVIDPEPRSKAFVRGTRTNRDLASSW